MRRQQSARYEALAHAERQRCRRQPPEQGPDTIYQLEMDPGRTGSGRQGGLEGSGGERGRQHSGGMWREAGQAEQSGAAGQGKGAGQVEGGKGKQSGQGTQGKGARQEGLQGKVGRWVHSVVERRPMVPSGVAPVMNRKRLRA